MSEGGREGGGGRERERERETERGDAPKQETREPQCMPTAPAEHSDVCYLNREAGQSQNAPSSGRSMSAVKEEFESWSRKSANTKASPKVLLVCTPAQVPSDTHFS